jgi:SIR2-like protein
MDPPSNYPDFNALANQVGGVQNFRQPGEAIDRYLGRLSAAGVTVHEQVSTILSNPESRPNANHTALVNLFKDSEQFRIVTTNFDPHFTTAARERFADALPEIFCAPALPLGNAFTGIVYLHGSVEKPASRLVLTDSDFGRAYITEGWATRFLERLFSHLVVLFVGYSHQDMLLTYLARGLTAGTAGPGRFALTPPGEDARWQNLGIVPIHYPLSEPPEPRHKELQIALSAWAEQSQAGALAVEERIRSIVTARVTLTPEEDDYLKHALSELPTLRFFTRHARGLEWLSWTEQLPGTQRLFALTDRQSPEDWELASWIANEFVTQHCNEMLELVRRKGIQFSAVLWNEIALRLFRSKVCGSILSKWLAVLLATASPHWRTDVLEYIFANCAYPDDSISAVLLFKRLTSPRLHLKESLRWSKSSEEAEKSVRVEIETDGSDYYLSLVWNGFFLPNIDQLAKSVAPIVASHLVSARHLLDSFENTSETWDSLNWSRGMIESRQQDHLRNGLSVLIDGGAAVMKWAVEQDNDFASSLIHVWYLSASPLLQRLAIYGRAIAKHIPADENLLWLAQAQLLYKPGFKHETFLLMQSSYPKASVSARGAFLAEVIRQHKPAPEATEYELFNVVSWLAKSSADCTLAAKLLAEIQARNPSFGEREHPDMDTWIGPVTYGGPEPVDESDEILSLDFGQILEKLRDGSERSPLGERFKGSAIRAIARGAAKSHEWGINIAQQARAQREWDPKFWQAIIDAWAVTEWTDGEWESIFSILEGAEEICPAAKEGLITLLHRGIQSNTSAIPL